MREPGVRWQVVLHLLITFAASIICCFLSLPAAVLLCLASLAMLAVHLYFQHQRNRKVAELSDIVNDILHGVERVDFQEFQEGELSCLSAEIHKMTMRLREQNAALRHEHVFMKESMEDMSHQLRTPLTSMMLVLDILKHERDLPPRERMAYLQELCELLTRMQWLIETLLGLSRLEAGAVTFQKETVCCRTLIEHALEPLLIPLELKDVAVQVTYEGTPAFVGDRAYCAEALGNLFKNCMEHTPEGGTITIEVTENAIYTGIRITDTGPGIAPEELPHLFERFYRNGSFGKKGYGIGLAFAQKVIVAQNGSLQANNAPEGGAEFDIRMYKGSV